MEKSKRHHVTDDGTGKAVNGSTGKNDAYGSPEGPDIAELPEKELHEEVNALKSQLAEKAKQSDEYLNMLQRVAAEFDNYKKRAAKERDAIATDTMCEVFSSIIPVVDNLEKALAAGSGEQSPKGIREGVELIHRQLKGVMKKHGLDEIKCVGEKFDPEFHNAVMHVEDENTGEGVVVEELQKGYSLQDRIVRHSIVKVAN